MEKYLLSLKIDTVPKSLNRVLNTHFQDRSRSNRAWDQLIKIACARKMPSKPLTKAKISIVRHSFRSLDYDNLVASMKPISDALVSCGVLIDDNYEVTGPWNVTQEFRPKSDGPMLEIMIEEV